MPEFLSRFERRQRAGDNWLVRCPSHDDKKASLSVGDGGDRLLLNCHAGCPTAQVVESMGLMMADLFYEPRVSNGGSTQPQVVAEYEYRDENGELQFVVERLSPKSFRQKRPDGKGGWIYKLGDVRRIPYNLQQLIDAPKDQPVFIVEGEKDADVLNAHGFCATTKMGGASKWPPEWNHFFADRRVVLLPDNDDAGRKYAADVAGSLEGVARSVAVINLSGLPDKGDVHDWFRGEGTPDKLRHLVEEKENPLRGIVFGLDDLSERVVRLYKEGVKSGVSTGFRTLDPYFKVPPGQLIVVTGIPSHGKSTWLDQVIANVVVGAEWVWGIFSAENLPLERHVASLLPKFLRSPFNDGETPRMSESAMRNALKMHEPYLKFIHPVSGEQSVKWLIDIADAMVDRYGINALVVDPWNELAHSRPSSLSETEYVGMALSEFRKFGRSRNVTVVIVAHPTKMQKEEGTNRYMVPKAYDISGSANWYNKADMCVTVWRDATGEDLKEPENRVQIHVQKVRFREHGEPGMVEVLYDRASTSFRDDPSRLLVTNRGVERAAYQTRMPIKGE